MYVFGLIFILTYINSFTKGDDDLIVELIPGKIKGHILQSYEGKEYYAFQEIPYAEPPVGKNRFQLPKKPQPWTGILDTTKNTKVCVQKNQYELNKTEDCLYLNVYSPVKPNSNERLPVLFWIHGGGLNWGSGTFDDYGPKYIMDYGIVVVAINYRLNAFGFATTNDDVIPANRGLKDTRLALEWVQEHIALFGGNPDHVVIAGESSGSAVVGLLVLGDWQDEKPLFHGAIQESGSMIGGTIQWTPKDNIMNIVKRINPSFNSEKSEDILNFLLEAKAEDILAGAAGLPLQNVIETSGYFSLLPLQTYMDGNIKKVPMLLGWNSEEYIKNALNRGNKSLLNNLDNNPDQLIHPNIHMSPANRTLAGKLYKKVYTNTTFIEDFAAYIRWSSDQSFATPTGKQIELGSVLAPYYVYQFSYKGELGGMMDEKYYVPGAEGVGHMEDLHYWWVFQNNEDITKFPAEDQRAMKRFLKLWTNFIKYLNPTPAADPFLDNVIWPKSNPQDLTYLNINSTLEVRNNPRVYRFVKPIIEKYMEEPYAQFG